MSSTQQIPGPAGELEILISQTDAESANKPASALPWAVLCHPHPQYGGSMHDGVLDTASSALLGAGINTLRFNFRGVGGSTGSFDQGEGETTDVLAAMHWCSKELRPSQILLVGYSFGSAMAWAAHRTYADDPSLAALWLIAPPVSMFSNAPGNPPCPVEIFHPAEDDFTPASALSSWQKQNAPAAKVHLLPGANHFFAGQLQALAERCSASAIALR